MRPQIPFKVSQTAEDNNNWNNMHTCIIILANITKTVVYFIFLFSPNKLLSRELILVFWEKDTMFACVNTEMSYLGFLNDKGILMRV